jgi:drug/metabolite transporter (DMT)-like permease
LPGISAAPLVHSLLMAGAGVAWGIYSLLGKGVTNPVSATAGNFLRATPCVVMLSMVTSPWAYLDSAGVSYAILSGALASGLGYVIWYAALRGLEATSAGTVQLSVPVIAAIGGIFFLNEMLTIRLLISSALVLGGIAVVIRKSGEV